MSSRGFAQQLLTRCRHASKSSVLGQRDNWQPQQHVFDFTSAYKEQLQPPRSGSAHVILLCPLFEESQKHNVHHQTMANNMQHDWFKRGESCYFIKTLKWKGSGKVLLKWKLWCMMDDIIDIHLQCDAWFRELLIFYCDNWFYCTAVLTITTEYRNNKYFLNVCEWTQCQTIPFIEWVFQVTMFPL